ncbi:asparagine synthase-related protein [Chloroflexota bacterium]
MPGINLLFSWDKDIKNWDNQFSTAQQRIKHNHQYSETTVFSDRHCSIGYTKYESYPLLSFDSNNYKVIIDGIIYNKDRETIQSELSQIATLLDSDNAKTAIKEWILNSDGEYNILFYDCTKRDLYIFNDALGRLPLYYYADDKIIIVSREVSFITPFVNEIVFDKDTLTEYLLFSAPLEDRTLISNVKRLTAATLMKIRGNNKDLSFCRTHIFNLDDMRNASKGVKENAAELKNRLLEACHNRTESLKHLDTIVSLSGGLDSRVVALALQETGASFSATTMLDYDKTRYTADAAVAKIIAEKLHIPWQLLELPKVEIREIERLLQYKGGLNHVGNSFTLNYFDNIKKKHGANISYWTGDEGNWSVAGNSPTRRLHNVDELVQYILDYLAGTKLERIERYLNVDVQRLRDKIKSIVQGYPEKDLTNKYFHFVFFEYLFKVQYEQEDRNRVFFWSVAPMYSISFMDYALNIPNNQKDYYHLYREFLNALSPEIAKVNNEKWDYPVTAKGRLMWKRMKKRFYAKLPTAFKNIIKKIIAYNPKTIYPQQIEPEYKDYIVNIFKISPTISENFLNSGLETIQSDEITDFEFWNLLTIVGFINKTEKELNGISIAVR